MSDIDVTNVKYQLVARNYSAGCHILYHIINLCCICPYRGDEVVVLDFCCVCGELARVSALKGGECKTPAHLYPVVVVKLTHVAHEKL